MALETGNYVADLNTANPTSTDPKSQGDDHLRLIKAVLKNTFAGFPGLVVATGTEAQGATVNDYVVTVSPAPSAYTAGFFIAFKATHANAGAVTVQVNALAAKALKGVDGTAIEAGDIEDGGIVVAWFDGADFFLISSNDRAARAGDTYSGTHDFSNASQLVLPGNTSIGNVSAAEIAVLDGMTASTAELNVLDGMAASTAELNILDGAVISTAELNALDGISSNVQGQLEDKANLGGGNTFTGTQNIVAALGEGSTATTQTTGDNSTKVATTAFVVMTAFNAALPGQAGNAGKFVSTDGTNAFWAVSGIGSVATVSSAISISLTAASAGYQSVAMTAMGKHVSLPDATTMTVGGPRFIIKNDGGYPFGIRDNAGALVMAVAAGGIAYVTLKDASTAAGSWSVIGDNLEPGLITIDSTFSSTYAGTVYKPFVVLDDGKSVHFLRGASSGYYAFVIDDANKIVGTPVLTGLVAPPTIAFKTALGFVVLDDTGAVAGSVAGTTITIGSYATGPGAGLLRWEDFSSTPLTVQLSPSLYLIGYNDNPSNTRVVAMSVSGTTVNFGSNALVTASAPSGGNANPSLSVYALSSTTAAVIYLTGSAPYAINAAVISVSGVTCSVGTPATLSGVVSWTMPDPPASCKLTQTKLLVAHNANNTAAKVNLLTISGTSCSFGADVTVEATTPGGGALLYYANGATRHNARLFPLDSNRVLLWYFNASAISRTVVLSESGGQVSVGTMVNGAISIAQADNPGTGIILPQGISEFVSYRLQLFGSAGYAPFLSTCAINGNSISPGKAKTLPAATFGPVTAQLCGKLSSGKYVLQGSSYASIGTLEAFVFSSNGDTLAMYGSVKLPPINPIAMVGPMAVITNCRVILVGTPVSTGSGGAGAPRFLNVEIAQ